MPGPPESALGNDSGSDLHDGVGASSQHTRSNSVTFDSQESPSRQTASPSYRHSTHYHRPSLPASRHSSSGGLSPPKRDHHASMDGNDVPRPKLGKKGERTRRKHSSRKSGAQRDTRAIDYGLGLLDDPSFFGRTHCDHQFAIHCQLSVWVVDPSTRARIAELQSRIEHINPIPPIVRPAADFDAKAAPLDPLRTPPPRESIVSVESPPRIEFPTRTSSPHPTPSTSRDGQILPQRGLSQRRRINSMFVEVKEKFASKSPGKHPASNHSLVDPNRVVAELRAGVYSRV